MTPYSSAIGTCAVPPDLSGRIHRRGCSGCRARSISPLGRGAGGGSCGRDLCLSPWTPLSNHRERGDAHSVTERAAEGTAGQVPLAERTVWAGDSDPLGVYRWRRLETAGFFAAVEENRTSPGASVSGGWDHRAGCVPLAGGSALGIRLIDAPHIGAAGKRGNTCQNTIMIRCPCS